MMIPPSYNSVMARRAVAAFVVVLSVAIARSDGGATPFPKERDPILIELFTSEGCSSCPPADALLQQYLNVLDGPNVIGLGEHVDYWDQLGWKDRFSSPVFTTRQQQYARVFNVDSIYTPQMVVDGREQFVGSDASAARRAIASAAASPHAAITLAIEPASADRLLVSIAAANVPPVSRGDRADFILAFTESGLRSDVRAGENKGRALTHAAVVRQITTIGELAMDRAAARGELKIDPGWQRDHLNLVGFVQERKSRHVLGAASVPLPRARP